MVAIICSLCGANPPVEPDPAGSTPGQRSGAGAVTAATAPMTWVYEFDARRGGLWLCTACAREHLRSIEAGLDRDHW